MKLTLISGELCPFAHRVQILLNHLKVQHKTKMIDIFSRPAWLDKISPLRKIPILLVDDKSVVFESSVISEFLHEISQQNMLSTDPLKRAKQRAWVEFGNQLTINFHRAAWASNITKHENLWQPVKEQLINLNTKLEGKNFFESNQFGWIDSAFASVLLRIKLMEQYCDIKFLLPFLNVAIWQDNLINHPDVISGHPKNFKEIWEQRIDQKATWLKSERY